MNKHDNQEERSTVPMSDGDADITQTMLQKGMLEAPVRPGARGAVGRFEILRPLAAGGMGQVFLAREPVTDGRVAIKMIRLRFRNEEWVVRRFLAEAQHMYRMSHPHILKVMEVSDRQEGPYYVMPFMEGGSLAQTIHPGKPLPEDRILEIARQVADALKYAHSRGIIHRDLKPANVLLDKEGRAYLTDFGLLRTVFNDAMVDPDTSGPEGTAAYMSPLAASGKAEDTRCDIYAFGAVLYEMLTGSKPYEGPSSKAIIDKILSGPPRPIRELNRAAPAALVRIAESCMARELRDRYAEMADVARDLERVARGEDPLGPHGATLAPVSRVFSGKGSVGKMLAVTGALFQLVWLTTTVWSIVSMIRAVRALRVESASGMGAEGHLSEIFLLTSLPIFVAYFLCLAGLIMLIVALFVSRYRAPWFYKLSYALAIISLLGVPIGTIVGILIIMYLRNHKGEFAAEPAAVEPTVASRMKKGLILAVAAILAWGLFAVLLRPPPVRNGMNVTRASYSIGGINLETKRIPAGTQSRLPAANAQASGAESKIAVNISEAPLRIVAQYYAQVTGKSVILSPQVDRELRCTLNSNGPVPVAEAAHLIEAYLSAAGLKFTVVGNNSLRIDPAGSENQPSASAADPATAEPPRLVSTTPAAGATDVDPATSEIVVAFDSDMAGGFSWTGGGPDYPPIVEGQGPHWRDPRTCVLPVKLEPGHYYRVGINSKSHGNFRSKSGVSARPSVIYFTTRGASEELKARVQKPVILEMSPANGSENVDPRTTELRVTFSVPMGGGFSWTGGEPDFPAEPEGTGPRWTGDQRTCVLPVRLEPNRQYRLGLNSPSHKNFQSAAGVPLDPVIYTFKTETVGNTSHSVDEPASPDRKINISFTDAPLSMVAQFYANLVGKPVNLSLSASSPDLRCSVTSKGNITEEDAARLIESNLYAAGWQIVPDGSRALKIEPVPRKPSGHSKASPEQIAAESLTAKQLVMGVENLLMEWKADIEAFDFDKFAALISDDASFTVTDPNTREVQHFSKQEYINSLRQLAATYTGYEYIVDERVATRYYPGQAMANVKVKGKQKVTKGNYSLTRGMSSDFTIRLIDGKCLVVEAVIVPNEQAE